MRLSVDGHEVYAYTGTRPVDPAAPAIVFVHGAANDHSVWALQSRYFAHHGHGVLAVDLPGHGRSGGPALATVEAILVRTRDN
jgi:pimeloyl-ACP methyl ester carboxylesterase